MYVEIEFFFFYLNEIKEKERRWKKIKIKSEGFIKFWYFGRNGECWGMEKKEEKGVKGE